MILLVVIILTIVLIFCVCLYTSNLFGRPKDVRLNDIPGPLGYPVLGNVLEILVNPENLWKQLRKFGKKYYPIYKYYIFSVPVVNIICPEDMKIIMTSSTNITKGEIYHALEPWLGTGLITSTGKKWQHRRKLITPTFHFNILQDFIAVFNEHTQTLIKRLEDECLKSYTDVIPIIAETTLETICETAMGTRLDKSTKSSQEYINSVYRMGEFVIKMFTQPWHHFLAIAIFTPTFWEHRSVVKKIHKFSKSVIEERKRNFEEIQLKRKRMALLDILITAQKSNQNIDDEGIREEVDTFMFAGHDTTTSCISFTLLLLACHPDIQNKVVDELKIIFEDSDRNPTFQDLNNMHYLDQVLKESLRVYPTLPFVSRITEEDFKTSHNYTIPKGTTVQLHIYDLHHNEKIYPNPEKFDPERFSIENSKERHPFAFIPFSAGLRNCIGQKFALLEVKTVVSTILRNYEVRPIDTQSTIKMVSHIVIKPKDGIKIKFVKRK